MNIAPHLINQLFINKFFTIVIFKDENQTFKYNKATMLKNYHNDTNLLLINNSRR